MYQLKKERIPLCALFLDQLLKHEERMLFTKNQSKIKIAMKQSEF